MNSIFDARIPIEDLRSGREENTNGGAYVWRDEFYSPCVGVYFTRSVASFHGDLEEYPKWEQVTLGEYYRLYKQALKKNAALPKDLRVAA